jgi:4,5-dihydroxyphthalate decarboxylase
MSAIELTAALTVNDRTRPLLDGSVKPAGIDLVLSPMESAEMFWRQLEFGEFDVSEMSLSALSCIVASGNRDWLALPVFTMRRFYHTQLLVRADAGITVPADLRGKRAGVPDYLQTSVVWARGILADEFGVEPADLEWFMERDAGRSLGGATGFEPPRGVRFSHLAPEQSLDRMLLDGELDVLFHYITARNLVDPVAESARYYRATGMYPVNHCVVVRRSVLERYPFVALNLFDAFQAAAERVIVRGVAALEAFVNAGLVARDVRDAMARDPWAYGIAASKRELETLFGYLCAQGISRRLVTVEEVFVPSTLGL